MTGERNEHAVERLLETFPEVGCERALEPGERIDHEAFRANAFYGLHDLKERFIHRKGQGTQVKDLQLVVGLWSMEVQSERGGATGVFGRPFLEHRDDRRFTLAQTLGIP